MFEKVTWHEDRITFNGVTFLLEGKADPGAQGRDKTFWIHKDRRLLDEYDRTFADYRWLHVRNFLELGIWKGGSAVLWMEALQPSKYVAIDYLDREDTPAFKAYLKERGLEDRLRTYWRTDQGDAGHLQEIVRAEFDGPLDMVIDDASHAYSLTKKSFETLFPLLGANGIYVIEDWAWQFVPELRAHYPSSEPGLHPLISELSILVVAAPEAVTRLDVRLPFLILQRGPMPEAETREVFAHFLHKEPSEPGATEVATLQLMRLKNRVRRLVRGPRPGE
jgi:hypothetical protein